MEVAHVVVRERGTAAKKMPSTTAGLTSAYQRTNISTSAVAVAETTGGYMLTDSVGLPWPELLSIEPWLELDSNLWLPRRDPLAEGYKSMADENSMLAEEFLPIAREAWEASEK